MPPPKQKTKHVCCVQNLRGEDVSDEMFAFEQRKREVHLAVLLQQRLQPYVVCMLETGLSEEQRQEQIKEWETEMRKEAQALCGVGAVYTLHDEEGG